MRWTSSSISRSTTSGATRRRCRALSPGCVMPQTEVKRDMEIARDEVRVMTVHGAKGLEAPIVILADTMTPPTGPKPPRLLELAGGAVIWAGRKEDDVPSVAAARDAARSEAENEYRRLLYVAMTRAADRLIICGADGRTKRPERCWYDLVREPLEAFLVEEDDGGEKVLRYRKTPSGSRCGYRPCRGPGENRAPHISGMAAATRARRSAARRAVVAVVGFRRGHFADRAKRRLRGRSAKGAGARAAGASADASAARYSGRAPQGRRRALSRQRRRGLYPGGTGRRWRGKCSPFSTTRTSPRFLRREAAPRCRSSAASRARAASPIPVAGQVDRLAVTGDTVLIADYKTDRIVPRPARRSAALRHPARALPRGAGPRIPGKNRARGAAVHRWAEAHGSARRDDGQGFGRGIDQAFTGRMTEGSRRGEAPLTPLGSVHRFNGLTCRFFRKK